MLELALWYMLDKHCTGTKYTCSQELSSRINCTYAFFSERTFCLFIFYSQQPNLYKEGKQTETAR